MLILVPHSIASITLETSPEEPQLNHDIHYQSPHYTIQTGDTLSRIARDWGRSTGQSSRQLTHKVTLWLRDNNYDAFSSTDGNELIAGNTLYLPTPAEVGVTVKQRVAVEQRVAAEREENGASAISSSKQLTESEGAATKERPESNGKQREEDTLQPHHHPKYYNHIINNYDPTLNPSVIEVENRISQLWAQGIMVAIVLILIRILFFIYRFTSLRIKPSEVNV